jgi:hypothetical protein
MQSAIVLDALEAGCSESSVKEVVIKRLLEIGTYCVMYNIINNILVLCGIEYPLINTDTVVPC